MRIPPVLPAIAVAAAALGCRASAPVGQPRPRTVLHAAARRVVLLSIDGLAATRHDRLVAQRAYTDQAGLAAFESWGYVVERAIPVEPTLTATNHATIATGAVPGVTGIVSNRFRTPGSPLGRSLSGFEAPLAAEPLWVSLRRRGKRVGALAFPGCDGRAPERRADFGMVWVDAAAAPARTVALDSAAFAAIGTPPGAPVSLAPLRRASLQVVFAAGAGVPTAEFALVAADTSDDGVAAYDALLVDDDLDLGNGVLASVRAGGWFPLAVRTAHPDGGTRVVGAWCLLQELDDDLARVRLYRGAFHSTEAYPRAFRERLDAEASFWPGPADDRALERGVDGREEGFSLDDYLAQARRFTEYFSACARAAIAQEPFDVLLAYQPAVDEAQHALTISDPRQVRYSDGLAATAANAVDRTYLMMDAAVADLARALDLSSDALVVVSDHGIAPVWETVHGNEVLRRAGLAEMVDRGGRRVVGDTSQAVVVASGGCAHLYVNQAGREPAGVVPQEQAAEIVAAAARAFAALELAGEPMVEAALSGGRLADAGLAGPNSGDLVLFMRPGIAVTGSIGGALHEPAVYNGQHGFRNRHPEMHGVLLARGAAVPRRRRAEASLTEVAAMVSHLAGVQPPRDAAPWQR